MLSRMIIIDFEIHVIKLWQLLLCFALKDSTFPRVNMTNDSGTLIIMFYSRYMPSTRRNFMYSIHTYTHTNTHTHTNLMYAEIRR